MNDQHFTICIYVATKPAGKGRQWYKQGSIFQHFQGATPDPPRRLSDICVLGKSSTTDLLQHWLVTSRISLFCGVAALNLMHKLLIMHVVCADIKQAKCALGTETDCMHKHFACSAQVWQHRVHGIRKAAALWRSFQYVFFFSDKLPLLWVHTKECH